MATGPLLSFILCVSDPRIAEEYALPGLRALPPELAEIVVLENVGNCRFTSIAAAYNAGAAAARGDYLVFVHQDVRFSDPRTFEPLTEFVRSTPFGIAGPAGVV
ncbi:MAG: glycosyltransferase, partial [Thermoplasmata archaeon]|nr:glycosyltransferase [Thermoplasmata archaeon]